MRILIVTQYFWPESFRVNDIALGLKERGHIVEILTGKPNYGKGKFFNGYSFFNKRSENWNGIKIHRSPIIARGNAGAIRLIINYLSFAFFASIRSFFIRGKFDKIIVYQLSPVTVGIPAIILKWRKKTPVFFYIQDLWPQSVIVAGGIKNNTIIKLLDNLTRWLYKKSDKILIQSEAFREVILTQGVNNNKIEFYPNSVESFFEIKNPLPEYESKLPKGFKIMFAGNIGEAQDFETILEAASILKESTPLIKWVILGDGRKREFVKKRVEELNLEKQFFLLGAFPVEEMPFFFACADCLLVSLKKDYILTLTIPSKLQSYLACGKPILASLDGEGARILIEANAGVVSNSGNAQLLAEKALTLYKLNTEELEGMGQNGRKYFEAKFERELLLDELELFFKKN